MPCYFDPFTGTIGCTGESPPAPSGGAGAGGGQCAPGLIDVWQSLLPGAGPADYICLPCAQQISLPGMQLVASNLTLAQAQAQFPSAATCANIGAGGGQSVCWQLPSGEQIQLPPDAQPPAGSVPCLPTTPGGAGGTGVCPTCECSPCQCKRKCWLLLDGTYVWLGENDERPLGAIPCGQSQSPPEGVVERDDKGAQTIEVVPDLSCLTIWAWGSPEWCKCADLWQDEFAKLGQRVIDTIQGNAQPGEELMDLIWHYMFEIIDLPFVRKETRPVDMCTWVANALQRVMAHISTAYGDMQLVVYGVYMMRASVDTIESVDISSVGKAGVNSIGSVGFHAFGTGFESGGHYNREVGFATDIKYKLDIIKKVLDQLLQYYVPIGVLGVPDGIQLYSSGLVTLPQLRCIVQAAGFSPTWAEPLALAARARPTPYEWIAAWRRGKIADNQLADALRSTGFTVAGEQDILIAVTNVLPPPSDLVRFMLKSIGDPQVVEQFHLEDEFDLLYRGRIKQWALADGVSEEVLRGYHAAHWDVPSPGDLSVFWQRYSTNRDSPQANALPAKFTTENYDRALREQGIAPYWRPFYRAAQFGLLGQRQLQWGYQFGQLTDEELKNAILDTGLRPDLAGVMVGIIVSRTVLHWAGESVVRAYVKNGINEKGIRDYLGRQHVPEKVIEAVLAQVRIEATEQANEDLIKLLEKEFSTGGLDEIQLASALQALGLDQDQLQRIVLAGQRKKQVQPKQIPARELCQWYGSRLISRIEFRNRLVTLNYTPYDAELIIAKCEGDLSARQLKQEQRALQLQAATQRRRMSELSHAERQAQLASQRAARAIAAQLRAQRQAENALAREIKTEQAAAERAARKKELVAREAEVEEARILAYVEHIADIWSKKTLADPVESAKEITALVQQFTADGSATALEVLRAAATLVALPLADLPGQLVDLVTAARQQVAVATAITGEPTANGIAPGPPTGLG